MSNDGVRSYRDLIVWQKSMELAELAYSLTRQFPKEETFGLTAQIRRAAGSVPANIAEGYGREHRRSYIHFLRIAQGSLKEFETHVLLAGRVRIVSLPECDAAIEKSEEVGRMLRGLIRALQQPKSPTET